MSIHPQFRVNEHIEFILFDDLCGDLGCLGDTSEGVAFGGQCSRCGILLGSDEISINVHVAVRQAGNPAAEEEGNGVLMEH